METHVLYHIYSTVIIYCNKAMIQWLIEVFVYPDWLKIKPFECHTVTKQCDWLIVFLSQLVHHSITVFVHTQTTTTL